MGFPNDTTQEGNTQLTIYFTSDLHLGHTDILAFAQRPWKTIEEHDAAIIGNINSTVGKNDRLYILGDFTMRFHTADVQFYLDAIDCKNRWLIIGNHDKAGALFAPGAFVECCDYKELAIDGRLVCLSHYPMLDWNRACVHHGVRPADASIMLHGHIHSCTLATNGDNAREGIWRYDVGVDANFYRPVSYEQISDFISARDPNFPAEK